MEEIVVYLGQGDSADKHSQASVGLAASIHSSQQYATFRTADCSTNGSALCGVGSGSRLFVAPRKKALINVFSWGKDSVEQRMPVPEQLSCLAVAEKNGLPWILAGGSPSGKIYLWEVSSGNLLAVKDAHYQNITVLRFSQDGTFLVSGSDDSTSMVWRIQDMVSVTEGAAKAYATFSDHTLAVTDVLVLGSGTDSKVYTCSADGTLRIYDLTTRKNLTTFVFPGPVLCIARDPANRMLYAGMTSGAVRTVPLYHVHNGVLESVGGNSKIVTIDADLELKDSSVIHKDSTVTQIAVTLDGTNLVSGDALGKVLVSDIVTRQVVKSFTPCNAAIASIHVVATDSEKVKPQEFKSCLLPQLKRVLAENNTTAHVLNMEIPFEESVDEDFDQWLQKKSQEELEFKHASSDVSKSSGSGEDSAKVKELEEKLSKLSDAYTDLRNKHQELFEEHSKLLSE